ncbi:hypothetical protein AAE478_010102 [Parahypoxylon ruwenzoriense]
MPEQDIPTRGTRTTLAPSVKCFLEQHPQLRLGGDEDFHAERRRHLEVFGIHALAPAGLMPASIGRVHFDGVRGRHGTIPVRMFYPRRFAEKGKLPALIYFHGGGYTVGSVDEFENGLRILAEGADVITIGVEYRLAPEFPFPTQLDEYEDVLAWTRSHEGARLGVDPSRIFCGGDSAGGNMTAALCLRLRDEGVQPLPAAQILLYPEARLPFDTPAATENNSGYYLECNGIFGFADRYLSRPPAGPATPPSHRYVSPGALPPEELGGLPPAAVFTCGFDPLRDVGAEYAAKLRQAGNKVAWRHFPDLAHGFLQMAPWSSEAEEACGEVARVVRELARAAG